MVDIDVRTCTIEPSLRLPNGDLGPLLPEYKAALPTESGWVPTVAVGIGKNRTHAGKTSVQIFAWGFAWDGFS